MALSDVLSRLRTAVGITSQRELARRSGLSRNTVNKLETGKSGAEHETLEKLADGLTRDPLTGRRDEPRFDAFLAVMVDALYGRDVRERLDRLLQGSSVPQPESRRRGRTGRTDYLAPIPGRRMTREQRLALQERLRRAVAEVEAIFDELARDDEGEPSR